MPIIGLTPSIRTARRMTLVYGVHPVYAAESYDFAGMVAKAVKIALRDGFAKKGDKLVVTAGVPFGMSGTTNTLRIATVEDVPEGKVR